MIDKAESYEIETEKTMKPTFRRRHTLIFGYFVVLTSNGWKLMHQDIYWISQANAYSCGQ